LEKNNDCNTIRFSFSKYNTTAEIDKVIKVLQELFSLVADL
jgi:cysteine sulfinate desulfinase/cysteine desulfurase-like protein